MANVHQTQQMQDSIQRKSENDIKSEILTSDRGHLTGIGTMIKNYVREQARSSQQSASSQSFVSFYEFQAL